MEKMTRNIYDEMCNFYREKCKDINYPDIRGMKPVDAIEKFLEAGFIFPERKLRTDAKGRHMITTTFNGKEYLSELIVSPKGEVAEFGSHYEFVERYNESLEDVKKIFSLIENYKK